MRLDAVDAETEQVSVSSVALSALLEHTVPINLMSGLKKPRASGGRLEVLAKDVVNALRIVEVAKNRHHAVSVSFDGENLWVGRGPTRVACPAEGRWPRTALVDRKLIKVFFDRTTAFAGTVVLIGRTARIEIGNLWIPCDWEP